MTQSIGSASIAIVTDDNQLKKVGKKGGGIFGKAFVGVAAGLLAAISLRALKNLAKDLRTAGETAATDAARIQQVAESMGLAEAGASGLTDRLVDLAKQTANLTGVEATQIRSAQAMLLTFSEVGASADEVGGVFDRATAAALDLAATGFGSAEGNASSLGIALNDPIAGLGRLTRVGVTFTDEQKDLIASLVETGDMLGAQEVLLGAVESQVGGVAEATANTSDRVKRSWEGVMETVGGRLMPLFDRFGVFLIDVVHPKVEDFALGVAAAFERLVDSDFFRTLSDAAGVFFDTLADGGGVIDGVKAVFADLAGDTSLFDFLVSAAQTGFDNLLNWLTTGGVATLVNWFVTSRVRLLQAGIELFRSLLDAVVTIVPELVQSLADALTQVVAFIAEAFPLLLQTGVDLFLALVDALVEILPQLIDTVVDVIVDVLDVVLDMVPQLLDAGIELFLALVDALVEVLPKLLDTILTKVVPKVIEVVLKSVPKLVSAAITLFFALVDAVLKILPQLIDTLSNKVIPEVIKTLIEMAPELLVAAIDLFLQMVKSLDDVGPVLLDAIIDIGKSIVKQVLETGPELFAAGVSMISDLGKGVLEQGKKLIKDVKDKIVGAITKLWPFSPAKDGPLRRFPPEEAGANIMRLFAEGIAKGGKDAVRAAALSLDGLMPTGRDLDIGGMRLAPAAGGSVVFDVSVVVNGSMTREAATEAGRTMAEEAQKQLDRLSRAKVVQ